MHEGLADSAERTYVDLNRSGVPLIEIVSEPDLRSPAEAFEYLTRLKEILLYTGVSEVSMEEGSLRCDANISVRPRGRAEFGAKSEIKNLNSFRYIREALEHEFGRHVAVLESGGRITQETRMYDPAAGKTVAMRSKEQAHDYRYFPEPDLPPLLVDEAWLAQVCAALPELPEATRARVVLEYGITAYDAQVLSGSRGLLAAFEEAARQSRSPKRVANLLISELMGRLHARGLEIGQSPISPAGLAMSADLAEVGTLTSKMLKDLYDQCLARGEDFPAVYEKEKPQQLTDSAVIERAIHEAMAENPAQLAQYRAGKLSVKAFFVGKVMTKAKGKANPALVSELLDKKLPG
jgi:aspartyl-tRNA(Asn)/glutamyl-tRNA(Gln) amidotransferase subunit B